MTSTPQQTLSQQNASTSAPRSAAQTPSFSGTASPAGRFHSSVTGATSQLNASESTSMSTAVGAPPSAHGHSESLNGRNTMIPAIPHNNPTTVNGGSPFPQGDHARKPSMTVTPAGTTGFAANGGAVGGPQNKANIQFGSINAGGSPALGTPATLAHQSSNLSVSSINPRMSSPQNSPSPIPQPVSASGGKPPPSLQAHGNPLSFGQFGGDGGDQNGIMRAQMPLGPQQDHMRRGSSQSIHSDMGSMPTGPGRGSYPQGGRGRGYPQYQQQMSYSPGQNFRPPNGRGMQANFQPQGRHPGAFPNSPNLGTRSPAMMNANPAGTPQMNHMQMMPAMQGQPGGYYMGNPHQVNNYPFPPRDTGRGRGKPLRGQSTNDRGRGDQPRGDRNSNRRGGRGRGRGVDAEQFASRNEPASKSFVPRNDPASDCFVPRNDPASDHYVPPDPAAFLPMPPHILAQFPSQDLSPESGNFEHFLTQRSQGVGLQSDPSIQAMYQQNSWAMMMNPQPMPGHYPNYSMPPQSPRPPFQGPQAPYMQPTYSNQGHPPPTMSRQSSQMSVPDRPGSSIGQPQAQTPSMSSTVTPSHATSRAPSVSIPAKSFTLPTKRSNAIVIKNAQGEVMDFSKQANSPAVGTPPTSTPVAPSIPTPPSRTASAADNAHTQTESASVKADEEKKKALEEEKRKAMQEAVKQKLAEEAKAKREQDEPEPEAVQEKETDGKAPEVDTSAVEERTVEDTDPEPAPQATEVAEEVPATEEEESAPAPTATPAETPKAAEDDEIDYDALEAEYAAQEAEEARREEEYQKKKAAQKEAEAQREREEEEAYLINLKQSEREAEEREDAIAKKKAEGGSDDEAIKKIFGPSVKVSEAHTPPSHDSPSVQTPAESGTATPVSDVSMPPPAKAVGPAKRGKVAELSLNTSKAIEPPEPSATLKALKSARLLQDPEIVAYPDGVASPNPALNSNAPAGRGFKYNKEFLLQFQKVFTEKPSLDWDMKIREALGDAESATSARATGSARTPSGMGARNPSNRASAAGVFNMGAFGQPQRTGPTQLPSGTTSEQRFALSNAAMMGRSNPLANNPFASGRPMGMPMGTQMSRNTSSTGLSGNLPSPRMGGGPSRGGSRAESKRNKHSTKQIHEENNKMPLTAGMDVGTLQVSSTGWKPRSIGGPIVSGPALGGEGHMAPDVVQRKVKSNLNKMTPQNFDKIADQILEIAAQSKDETDGRTLRQVIQLTFEKATDEAHWASMYAMFCQRMLASMSADIRDENIKDKNGNVVTGGNLFRKYLLNRCQEEFERGWKVNLPPREEGQSEEAAMLSDEYYIAAAAKRRGLGLVRFIGELFKLGMLTERIMHECVKKLLDYEGIPDEAEVESLTSLLKTVGANLDKAESKAQPRMAVYFERIHQIRNMPELPSRLQYMLLDIEDLRKSGWVSKEANKGPKTIEEIHAEAEAAAHQSELKRLASQNNRGGGRMPMGRGDARNFSGGYGQMPPPDNSTRVGTDDLRRLGKMGNRNPSTTSGTFGPSGMLSARTNSGRKGLGPGSLLARGEDSGTSSRTGTPPAQKEKEKKDESSNNAFSALAALEGQEGPASPPSNASSPPTQKSQPNVERERSRSPEKKE